MLRINSSLSSKTEQAILSYIAPRLPKLIGPDTLTALALLSAIGIGASYFYAPQIRELYIAAAALYLAHWFGDSLDGKIARQRGIARPRYGHYVDHMLDSISVAVILGGLSASTTTNTSAWLWVASGFLLLMIHAFLKANATGKFQMSLGPIGPTEARIAGAALSVALYFTGNPQIARITAMHNSYTLTLLDIAGMICALTIWTALILQIATTARMLDSMDRGKSKGKA